MLVEVQGVFGRSLVVSALWCFGSLIYGPCASHLSHLLSEGVEGNYKSLEFTSNHK